MLKGKLSDVKLTSLFTVHVNNVIMQNEFSHFSDVTVIVNSKVLIELI